MAKLEEGARGLPAQHLTIRVPWHDSGWKGTICLRPRENDACMALARISASRKDDVEARHAGTPFSELAEDDYPPCVNEGAAFMAPFGFLRQVEHPYRNLSPKTHGHFRATPFRHLPYSAACIPFRWMLKSHAIGSDNEEGLVQSLELGFQPAREPEMFDTAWVQERSNQLVMLDTFFSAVKPEETLCFFYAKKTPLAENGRKVIVGVGRVLSVDDCVEYKREPNEGLRCVLWERNVGHSIRPDFKDGFLFPLNKIEYLAKNEQIDPTELLAFAPDAHWDEFAYASEHLTHDGAIASLLECSRALQKIAEKIPGDWDSQLSWIDKELNRLWKLRGPYPGLGSALGAFGVTKGTLLAHEITARKEKADPWEMLETAFADPKSIGPIAENALGKSLRDAWKSLPSERKNLLKLLSRFELSEDQAERFYQPTVRKKEGILATDAEIIANPYLVFELDRLRLDSVSLEVIDRGLFPERVIREKYPIPSPSALDGELDARRVRAFVINELEKAAALGHSVQPREWIIDTVRSCASKPACPMSEDILGVVEGQFFPVVRKVKLSNDAPGYQLERFMAVGEVIRSSVDRRLQGKRHSGSHDWRTLLDKELGLLSSFPDQAAEDMARSEKAASLAELFASRFCVLTGPAGTGKTTLLRVLCNVPEVVRGGILLLAPTGKARVRLETKTGLSSGKTIAQFLKPERYDTRTGRYKLAEAAQKREGWKTVIVDEASMLTEEQLAALIEALGGVERLILVGDTQQLPPIGTGRPFIDIVRRCRPSGGLGFPRVSQGFAELVIQRRQTGGMRDDLRFADWFGGRSVDVGADEFWNRVEDGRNPNLRFVQWKSPEDLERQLLTVLVEELKLSGLDDAKGFETSIGGQEYKGYVYFHPARNGQLGAGQRVEGWQILSPVRSNLYGVDSMNRFIQSTFRRAAYELATQKEVWKRKTTEPFGPQGILYGDKVINVINKTRRNVFPKIDDPYVANGDIGSVVGQFKGASWRPKSPPWQLEVEFPTQPGIRYGYWRSEFSDDGDQPLELAYALTVHKAQGSEFGTTFVVLPNPCWLLSRELLYTALTRQQQRLVLLHQGPLRDLLSYSLTERSETSRRMTNLFAPPKPVKVGQHFLEEGLIHRTLRGDAVRSKSEVIIADRLYSRGIKDYAYERPFTGKDGSVRYPDFSIEDAESGLTVFWEHLGMLTQPAYREQWGKKLAWYQSNGILPLEKGGGPAGTLVVTQDDDKGGIDSQSIDNLIHQIWK